MTVESHGQAEQWLRDPVITKIDIDPRGPSLA